MREGHYASLRGSSAASHKEPPRTTTPDPWLPTFCVCALLVVLGMVAGLVDARLWISEPLTCTVLGIALGPVGWGLLPLSLTSLSGVHP